MKPFEELTHLGQVRRLRGLAQAALQQYDLPAARMTLIVASLPTALRPTMNGRSEERRTTLPLYPMITS